MSHSRYSPVTIKLITESIGRKRIEKSFSDQTVLVEFGETITKMSVDGHLSAGRNPDKIEWLHGSSADLKDVTGVEITKNDGNSILSGHLNRNFSIRNTELGVSFSI
jgi:hypothetical protein